MSRLHQTIVAATVVGSACSNADVFLEAPDASARSLLIAVEGTPTIYYAAAADGALRLELPSDENVDLSAALLGESLDDLGLRPGEVRSSAEQNVRPLPENATYFRTTVEGGAPATWIPSAASDALTTFRLSGSRTLAANCNFQAPQVVQGDDRPSGAPTAMPGGRLLERTFRGYRIIETDRSTTSLTVTATTTLIPKLADETGVFFTDRFGGLWHGEISLRNGRLETAPVRRALRPATRVETIIEADRPGRYIIANSEFTGLIDDGRFFPSFDYEGNTIHAARTDDGRVFVSVGLNLTELIGNRLEFRSLAGGVVLGLHFDAEEGITVLRRAGADAGAIVRWDPETGVFEDRHLLTDEGLLLTSLQTQRGISYLVDDDGLGAILHYVPGFGSCGAALVPATEPIRYLVAIGEAVTGIGGASGDVYTYVRPSP